MENLEQILGSSIQLDEKLLAMSDADLAEIYEASGKEYLKKVRQDLRSRIRLCEQILPLRTQGDNGEIFEEEMGKELADEVNGMNKMIADKLSINKPIQMTKEQQAAFFNAY